MRAQGAHYGTLPASRSPPPPLLRQAFLSVEPMRELPRTAVTMAIAWPNLIRPALRFSLALAQEFVHFFFEQPLDELLNLSPGIRLKRRPQWRLCELRFHSDYCFSCHFHNRAVALSSTDPRPVVIGLTGKRDRLSRIPILLDNSPKEFREKHCDSWTCPANSRQHCARFVSAVFKPFRHDASQQDKRTDVNLSDAAKQTVLGAFIGARSL